jgi:ferric-dicitrate binding protein FerR (iron transport regulator)
MLVYDGERLEVVFEDLKRTFNIDIRAGDPAINDYRLTSPFEHQPHDTIIKLICTTFNLHSVREEGAYTLYPGQAQ